MHPAEVLMLEIGALGGLMGALIRSATPAGEPGVGGTRRDGESWIGADGTKRVAIRSLSSLYRVLPRKGS